MSYDQIEVPADSERITLADEETGELDVPEMPPDHPRSHKQSSEGWRFR